MGGNPKAPGSKASGSSKASAKGGGKVSPSSRFTSDSYALQFPGALPVKQLIYVRDGILGLWREATIVHCRPCLDVVDPEEAPHYQYYVHFERRDRRLDCWASWDDIRQLHEGLPEDAIFDSEVEEKSDEEHAGMDNEYIREHEENTKVKTIKKIRMGQFLVDTWYFSPYPMDYQNIDVLFLCEFCLAFFKHETELARHCELCSARHPPGNEIYRDTEREIAVFEVDGSLARVYAENLCYVSKLFLDHKTLKHPVHLFLFYALTEITEYGYHCVGYFSKEKYSRNNLSCICVLPQYQRKGYGKFLIAFSYALSRLEGKRGTPERPLSDLGRASYLSYWTSCVTQFLTDRPLVSIAELADLTGIEVNDIQRSLRVAAILQAKCSEPFFILTEKKARMILEDPSLWQQIVKPNLLHWEPYDAYLASLEFSPNC
eukprot:Polyplicarium_translucidae@DN2300_c0_g1_i1.p2